MTVLYLTGARTNLAIANESGIDQSVTNKFPGSTAEYGSAVSGAGDNREIPVSEGGEIDRVTGQ